MSRREIAVIIPAHNEEQALPRVLAEIPGRPDVRVVVVDNASTDATAAVAVANGVEVVHEPRPGYGSACQAGLRHLASDPPSVVVVLDGDHSDYPEDLPLLVEPILRDEADLVCGSRVELAAPGALPPQVRWGNALATAMIRLLFGHRYRDMGPFRALRWESLQALGMRDPAYGWNAEMQVKALQRGLRVREVSVRYRPRTGTSKISGTLRGALGAGRGILGTILRLRLLGR
jgi:glycosyltransferase involved in cell wall biosynthesis